MNKPSNPPGRFTLLARYGWLLIFAWTALVAGLFVWNQSALQTVEASGLNAQLYRALNFASLGALWLVVGISILGFWRVGSWHKQRRDHTDETLRASEARYRVVADFTFDWEYWRAPMANSSIAHLRANASPAIPPNNFATIPVCSIASFTPTTCPL